MMESIILTSLAYAAVYTGITLVAELWARWRQSGQTKLPERVKAEMSDTDKEKIKETQQLIAEQFGGNFVESLRSASKIQRVEMLNAFAQRLKEEWGLDDIEVDIMIKNVNEMGVYNWSTKKAEFNIALLMVDGNDPNFEKLAREALDTIVHELRHAVQHRSIREEGFWNVDEERRAAWANNMRKGNYISPQTNYRGYANQPIESDAYTFAALVMEGVN